MLQKNAVTGFLFCFGIAINSFIMLLCGIIAILASLALAKICQYNEILVLSGVYSFNSALLGLAVGVLLPINVWSLIFLILGALLSTIIMHLFIKYETKLIVLTAPFIVSTWLLLLIIEAFDIEKDLPPFSTDAIGNLFDSLSALMRGIAQIMFQDHWLSGVIFVVALFLGSHKAALWALIGSGIGMLTAQYLDYSEQLRIMGIYGVNASLVAIVLSDYCEKEPYLIFVGILLCVLFTELFEQITLPALTAPFVITCWLILSVMNLTTENKELKH